MHGVKRFGLLLSMFRGLRVSQSVCLLDMTMSCAKTDELIEMPFGTKTRGPPREGNFLAGGGRPL